MAGLLGAGFAVPYLGCVRCVLFFRCCPVCLAVSFSGVVLWAACTWPIAVGRCYADRSPGGFLRCVGIASAVPWSACLGSGVLCCFRRYARLLIVVVSCCLCRLMVGFCGCWVEAGGIR